MIKITTVGLCNFMTFQGRLNYFCSLTSLTMRQVIKYLYIFKWRFVNGLEENFAALFLMLWNILMGTVFCFTTYFLGEHNSEVNYHYCTGKQPPQSINFQRNTTLKEVFSTNLQYFLFLALKLLITFFIQ